MVLKSRLRHELGQQQGPRHPAVAQGVHASCRRSRPSRLTATPIHVSLTTGTPSRRELFQAGILGFLATSEAPRWIFSPAQAAPSTLRPLTPEEQAAVNQAMKALTKSKAPGALRLVFHDAGTYSAAQKDGGANASIRFELDRPENFGLKRALRLIEQLADSLKGTPAAGLSYADLIMLAGAQAVAVCGGPSIPVLVGRLDATSADPEGRMPAETLTSEQLKKSFADKGFNVREFVALSGAHTIGSKGFGDAMGFDNVYYKELLKKPWLNTNDAMASMIGLPSDHVLPDDPELVPIIQEYANDEPAFFRDFTAAYIKLSQLGV